MRPSDSLFAFQTAARKRNLDFRINRPAVSFNRQLIRGAVSHSGTADSPDRIEIPIWTNSVDIIVTRLLPEQINFLFTLLHERNGYLPAFPGGG